ncbi:MAG: YggS family pyridoxal phosphate-dependent enzyme [Dehalococcoidales bacterium]|nr:YggS family pyridoxal phosphate-dependent enzyme [Dehalococcoidales bacterium]
MSVIERNVKELLSELPDGVELVAAAKTRQPEEVLEAVKAGIKIVGENYVQEAEKAYAVVGRRVKWHLIGSLQKNKVKKAVELFDMIESLDSVAIAAEIDRRCAQIGKVMPVLIEINSGKEARKSGVLPEDTEKLVREVLSLSNLKVMGLMTMGPAGAEAGALRPCFIETKRVFEKIKRLNLPGVEMKYLSMGMSDSYRIAIEEGANMIRLGTRIFGERGCQPSFHLSAVPTQERQPLSRN